ncbi:MotA/TolQ/ExbB proton channel family protein [Roseovarius sp. MMSF_3281]|uniref:MotA/TolQ/ExbB proton channel family protein n=1 Tax=Roseovarius sp. MMSF_3281 TaxID=3046694 RepID=UPI00273F0B66|nr:MotA/TolQ/ExbB proton channel family protein [Roseovarius sp. MMSF_3281]
MTATAPPSRHNRTVERGGLERWRPYIAAASLVLALCFIMLLHRALPDGSAALLLDRGGLTYPFSIQNGMWLVFFIGLGELAVRAGAARTETSLLSHGYLPEDPRTVLQVDDLPPIYRRARAESRFAHCFLPRLIERCILQFQTSRSIDQSALLLNTSIDMFLHEVDLRYSMLRYITWLIPSLGFIGTVMGIGYALAYAGDSSRIEDPNLLSELTGRLAVAFNTTLLALILAAIILFLQSITQSREERALNRAGQYCLDNFINRLYVAREERNDRSDRGT